MMSLETVRQHRLPQAELQTQSTFVCKIVEYSRWCNGRIQSNVMLLALFVITFKESCKLEQTPAPQIACALSTWTWICIVDIRHPYFWKGFGILGQRNKTYLDCVTYWIMWATKTKDQMHKAIFPVANSQIRRIRLFGPEKCLFSDIQNAFQKHVTKLHFEIAIQYLEGACLGCPFQIYRFRSQNSNTSPPV